MKRIELFVFTLNSVVTAVCLVAEFANCVQQVGDHLIPGNLELGTTLALGVVSICYPAFYAGLVYGAYLRNHYFLTPYLSFHCFDTINTSIYFMFTINDSISCTGYTWDVIPFAVTFAKLYVVWLVTHVGAEYANKSEPVLVLAPPSYEELNSLEPPPYTA